MRRNPGGRAPWRRHRSWRVPPVLPSLPRPQWRPRGHRVATSVFAGASSGQVDNSWTRVLVRGFLTIAGSGPASVGKAYRRGAVHLSCGSRSQFPGKRPMQGNAVGMEVGLCIGGVARPRACGRLGGQVAGAHGAGVNGSGWYGKRPVNTIPIHSMTQGKKSFQQEATRSGAGTSPGGPVRGLSGRGWWARSASPVPASPGLWRVPPPDP